MRINKSSAYFLKYLALLMAATAVLVLFALSVRSQPVLAQEETNENNQNENGDDENQEPVTIADDVNYEADEGTEGQLIFKFNAGAYNPDSEKDYNLKLDEEGKIVWQYIGPSSDPSEADLCDSLNATSLSDKFQSVEAMLIEDESSSEDNPTKAYVSLSLRSDAGNGTHYCFIVPLAEKTEDGQEDADSVYRPVILENQSADSTGEDTQADLVFSASAPATDKTYPASVTASLRDPDVVAIDEATWQYVTVENVADCSDEDAADLVFSEPSAEGNQVDLDDEDVGKVFCFRAALADNESEFVYGAYPVPTSTVDPVDDEGVSVAMVVAVVALVAVLGGGLIFFITRKKDA